MIDIFSCLIEMLVVNLTKVFRFRCQMESFNRWHFRHHLVISKSRHFLMILRSFFSPNFLNQTISRKFSKSTFFLRIYFFGGGIWHLARVRPIYRSRRLIGRFIGIGRLSDQQITEIPLSDRYRIGRLLWPISVNRYGYNKSPN